MTVPTDNDRRIWFYYLSAFKYPIEAVAEDQFMNPKVGLHTGFHITPAHCSAVAALPSRLRAERTLAAGLPEARRRAAAVP